MDRQKELYRQQMIGRLQLWESKVAHLKNGAQALDGTMRLAYETRLRDIEYCNRDVYGRYADLLLAEPGQYDEKRTALDAAARLMDKMLIDFALQPAY